MLTRVHIENEKDDSKLLLLAPLTVRLDQRSKGLGGQLLAEAETAAKAAGNQAIILLGDPAYYERYGYQKASDFGFSLDQEMPLEYLLVKKIGQADLTAFAGKLIIPV